MKTVTINKDNIQFVYGRLKKFFNNNNNTCFETWFNLNCGFKKRIKPMWGFNHTTIIGNHIYENDITIMAGDEGIWFPTFGMDINDIMIGDKISFLGNRIVYSKKVGKSVVYTTIQVLTREEYNSRISQFIDTDV